LTLKSLNNLLPPRTRKLLTGSRMIWPIVGTVVLVAGMSFVILRYDDPFKPLGAWGYPGIFLVMLINNLTIFLPSVGHAFLLAAAQTLNPWLLGIVGGAGAAVGELSGYVVGHSGGRVLIGRRLYDHYRNRAGVRGNFLGPTLLVFAATPLPMDIAGIVAGAVHYPVGRFMLWVGAGKIIQVTMIALASYYAIGWIKRIFFAD
jgi:membrane protein DedA with SNARE-associated domain